MEKINPTFIFIDRDTYNALISGDFNDVDIIEDLIGKQNKISIITKNLISFINFKLNNVLPSILIINKNKLTKTELKNQLNNYYSKFFNNDTIFEESSKYYELKPLPDLGYILVIIESCFIIKITESKDELEKFILDCLCTLNKFKFQTVSVMKQLLAVRMSEFKLKFLKNQLL